jgi:hypothetical protein
MPRASGACRSGAFDPELTSSSPNPKHYFVTPERTVVPAKGALLRASRLIS